MRAISYYFFFFVKNKKHLITCGNKWVESCIQSLTEKIKNLLEMFQIVCHLQIEDILIKKNSERYSKKTARRYRKKMQKDRVEKKMQEDVGKKCRRKRCKFIFYYIFYLKVEGSFILFGGLLAQFSDAFAFFFYF